VCPVLLFFFAQLFKMKEDKFLLDVQQSKRIPNALHGSLRTVSG